MNLAGFDLKGCLRVKVIGYSLTTNPTGELTDISQCTVLLSYAKGPPVEMTIDVEMNLQSFLASIDAVNAALDQRNHHRQGGSSK